MPNFDRQNLTYSATYLINSLTPKFRREVQNSVGLAETGLEVFICILRRKFVVAVSLQRELIEKLQKMYLVKEPGENIPSFKLKILELCESIESSGPPPADLNLLVMKAYINSQVPMFSQTMGQLFLEIKVDPSRYHWQDILCKNQQL